MREISLKTFLRHSMKVKLVCENFFFSWLTLWQRVGKRSVRNNPVERLMSEMQALCIRKMRYVTPLLFNYSFAVNNYRSMLHNDGIKYRQMQFVVTRCFSLMKTSGEASQICFMEWSSRAAEISYWTSVIEWNGKNGREKIFQRFIFLHLNFRANFKLSGVEKN